MNRVIAMTLPMALLLVLGACGFDDDWTPAQAKHVNQVKLAREMHSVSFAPGATQPQPKDVDRLVAMAGQGDGQPMQVMYVPDAGRSIARERAAQLQRALQARGVAATPPTQLDPQMAPPGTVIVATTRLAVTPPSCADWSKRSETNHDNLPPSNYGCATARNLGVMVADPADLTRGRDYGGQDGTQATGAIQRYRAGKVTPLPPTDTKTTGGTGSN
jgi:pilus assembly protein CpaD